MPFACEQAAGRVQPNPARTRQIDLRPCVEVTKVCNRTNGTLFGNFVGFELNEITRDKPCCYPQLPEHLDQQPCRISARPTLQCQRFFRCLHTGFEADEISNLPVNPLIYRNEEINNGVTGLREFGDPPIQNRTTITTTQIGRELTFQGGFILKRPLIGTLQNKKVKRIDHRHLCNEIDRDPKLPAWFRKHKTSDGITKRILLPVHKMLVRFHA